MAVADNPSQNGRCVKDSEARLEELNRMAATLRAELEAVEAAIVEEQKSLMAALGTEEPPMLHKRPSWSLLGGTDGAVRQLDHQDADFETVLKDHPELKIGPVGAYNHWDRRECAVQNADEWRARCQRYMKELGGTADIPKVIHQIWVGPREPPCLWIDTFRVDYCGAHPSWAFELWDDARVKKLPMLNGKIYDEEKMWQCKADILRLEFLWHHGGVYVDADMISVGNKSLDPIIEKGKDTGFVIAYEPDTKDKPYSILGNSVIACTAHHPLILMLILFLKQTYYQKRFVIQVFEVTGPVLYTKCLVDSRMPITIADMELLYPAFHFVPNPDAIDFSRFPKCLMFQFGYTCSGLEGYVKRRNRCKSARTCPFHSKKKPLESYRRLPSITEGELSTTIPIGLTYLEEFIDSTPGSNSSLPLDDGVGVVVTDGAVLEMERLRMELPGYVDRLRGEDWDVMLFGAEWSTGTDEPAVFRVPPNGRPRNSSVCGLFVNVSGSRRSDVQRSLLRACITERGFDPTALFDSADRLALWFAAEKYAGTMEEARIYRSMATVHRIFTALANHHPPMHFDNKELHGNLMVGLLAGRRAFEIKVENNGAVQFRAWNDDQSPNCEMSSNGTRVDWMKVFYNHQVVFEAQGRDIP